MIEFKQKGDWSKTATFGERVKRLFHISMLDEYGKRGVDILKEFTPVDTGKTADSWYYEIKKTKTGYVINWRNSNINEQVVVAIVLQYGHGIDGGGFVEGTDYVNPAMKPLFKDIADDAWRKVNNDVKNHR